MRPGRARVTAVRVDARLERHGRVHERGRQGRVQRGRRPYVYLRARYGWGYDAAQGSLVRLVYEGRGTKDGAPRSSAHIGSTTCVSSRPWLERRGRTAWALRSSWTSSSLFPRPTWAPGPGFRDRLPFAFIGAGLPHLPSYISKAAT